MALIKCSNCGNMISDKAKTCPKCGAPVGQQNNDAVADLMYREAVAAMKKGNYAEARDYINGLLAVKPGDARFLALKQELEEATLPKPQVSPNGRMVACPNCRQMISSKATTCPKCGRPVVKISSAPQTKEQQAAPQQQKPITPEPNTNLIVCNSCGHQMSPRAMKCPKCGALSPKGEAQEKERQEAERKQQEERRQQELKQKAENEARLYQAAVTSLDNGNYFAAHENIDALLAGNPKESRFLQLKKKFDDAFGKRVKDLCGTIEACLDSGRLDDAQDDLNALINLNADESTYRDLKQRLDDALWQRAEQEEKAARRRKKIIGSVTALAVLALLAAGGYFYYNHARAQEELALWQQIEQSSSMADIDQYLADFPEGEHVTQVQELKAKVQEIAEQWAQIENSNDAFTLQEFIDKYPEGAYHDRAVEALDKALWLMAVVKDAPAAYNQYLKQCPQGAHVSEAEQWLQQHAQQQAELQEKLKLSQGEINLVSSRVSSFFYSMASGNASGMTELVASPMASFLGKKNATASDVIAYMRRVHSGDVYGVDITMGNVNVKKSLTSNGDPVYTATFGFDQRLSREDATQETFAHYNGTATVNDRGLITSIGLNKTSHY